MISARCTNHDLCLDSRSLVFARPPDYRLFMGKISVTIKLTNYTEDLVIDLKGQQLIPNPEHGGRQVIEEYLSGLWIA